MLSSLDECVPSPLPSSSSDVIKQKNRMESLPLFLRSVGIIRHENKLGGPIQLSWQTKRGSGIRRGLGLLQYLIFIIPLKRIWLRPPQALLQYIQSNCWDSLSFNEGAVVLLACRGQFSSMTPLVLNGCTLCWVCVCVPWWRPCVWRWELLCSIQNQFSLSWFPAKSRSWTAFARRRPPHPIKN